MNRNGLPAGSPGEGTLPKAFTFPTSISKPSVKKEEQGEKVRPDGAKNGQPGLTRAIQQPAEFSMVFEKD